MTLECNVNVYAMSYMSHVSTTCCRRVLHVHECSKHVPYACDMLMLSTTYLKLKCEMFWHILYMSNLCLSRVYAWMCLTTTHAVYSYLCFLRFGGSWLYHALTSDGDASGIIVGATPKLHRIGRLMTLFNVWPIALPFPSLFMKSTLIQSVLCSTWTTVIFYLANHGIMTKSASWSL